MASFALFSLSRPAKLADWPCLYGPSLEYGALPGSAMHGLTGTARAWHGLACMGTRLAQILFCFRFRRNVGIKVLRHYIRCLYRWEYKQKVLNLPGCGFRPFLIYDFATAPFWISLYMRKIWCGVGFFIHGLMLNISFDMYEYLLKKRDLNFNLWDGLKMLTRGRA
jgi:hypothetical protein